MDGKFLAIWLALVGGMVLPIQIGVNATLRRFLEHPIQATAVSFAVGACAAVLASLVLRTSLPSLEKLGGTSFWMWLGGILGAIYVFTTIYSGPKIGAALAVPLAIAGQVAMAMLIDHFGWLGFPQSSVTLTKLFGAAMVIGGVWLIAYAKHA